MEQTVNIIARWYSEAEKTEKVLGIFESTGEILEGIVQDDGLAFSRNKLIEIHPLLKTLLTNKNNQIMETNYSFVHIQMSAEVQVFQDVTIALSDKKEVTIKAAVIPRNFGNLVAEGVSFHMEKDEYIFETTFDSIIKACK